MYKKLRVFWNDMLIRPVSRFLFFEGLHTLSLFVSDFGFYNDKGRIER